MNNIPRWISQAEISRNSKLWRNSIWWSATQCRRWT